MSEFHHTISTPRNFDAEIEQIIPPDYHQIIDVDGLGKKEIKSTSPNFQRYNIGIKTKKARKIQSEYPTRILCGSLGLILLHEIKERVVGDLDFCQYMPQIKKDEYIALHLNKPYSHCLFLVSLDNATNVYTARGLKIQDPSVMIKWKKKFGRIKDLKDLEMDIDVYLTSEDFLLD